MTPNALLPDATTMDAVTLHVDDLPGMVAWYRDAVALEILGDEHGHVVLGRGRTPLVVLRSTPGLPLPSRGEAGLFHTAILFDDRASLAAAVASVVRHSPHSFVGSADHLVSLAFYFTTLRATASSSTPTAHASSGSGSPGTSRWTTAPSTSAPTWTGTSPTSARTIPTPAPRPWATCTCRWGTSRPAHEFYVSTLGFEQTAGWHGALFVSAGGYHHHMAMNTWNSRGAGPRASTLGLGEVTIRVPSAARSSRSPPA
jgi:catechol 2,3-dioxygenase